MSSRAFIAVGSNIDAERNVASALELLGRRVQIVAVSNFYRTPALGAPGSPDFLNGVVEIESELEPRELKRLVLLDVESALGRERGSEKNAPRTIDELAAGLSSSEMAPAELFNARLRRAARSSKESR